MRDARARAPAHVYRAGALCGAIYGAHGERASALVYAIRAHVMPRAALRFMLRVERGVV